jgi:hypothetical protein
MSALNFHYTMRGCVVVPEGSKLNEHGTGVILPDGRCLKVWEQLELHTPGEDDYENLDYNEAEALGIFFDGGLSEFEDGIPVNDGDQIFP